MNPNSASPNQNQPGNTPRLSLREALLQQISPAEVAEAEANALAALAPHPQDDSPVDLPDDSPDPLEDSAYSARHSRRCKICNSPDREEIDQAYIHWVPLARIVHEFRDVSSAASIHRHAIATDLFARRRSRFQHALDRIIEKAGDTAPTADAVIRAIRASSLLNENGRWDEPPRRVIIEHHVIAQPPAPALTPAQTLPQSPIQDLAFTPLHASVPRDVIAALTADNHTLDSSRTARSAKRSPSDRNLIRNDND